MIAMYDILGGLFGIAVLIGLIITGNSLMCSIKKVRDYDCAPDGSGG